VDTRFSALSIDIMLLMLACSFIALLPNVVRSTDKKSVPAGALRSSVLAPFNVPAARALVQAPSTVGSCDGATLFGTASDGQAGRPLSYGWELSNVAGSIDPAVPAAVATAFASLVRNRPRLDVPEAVLPGGLVFSFTLTVSNWLGSLSSQTVQVRWCSETRC